MNPPAKIAKVLSGISFYFSKARHFFTISGGMLY